MAVQSNDDSYKKKKIPSKGRKVSFYINYIAQLDLISHDTHVLQYLPLMLNRKSTLDIGWQILDSSNKQRDTEELLQQN